MGICSERSPVTGFFVCFVGDGTFHDKNEWSQFSVRRIVEPLEEFITVLKGEDGVVEAHFGNPGDGAEHEFFDAWLRGRGERDRIAIATEPRCEPEDIHHFAWLDDERCFPMERHLCDRANHRQVRQDYSIWFCRTS